jgi:hypothetical protein
MNLEEAKAHKKELDSINRKHSEILQQFEVNGMGLVPDNIRATPEWKQAKQDFDRSFSELRKFNQWFVKEFRKKRK